MQFLEFKETLLTSFDGRQKAYGTTMTEGSVHIQKVLQQSVSEQQRINFTKAALIRYFDACCNITYHASFLVPAQGSYAVCYEIHYSSVSVDIATDSIRCQLYYVAVPARWEHYATLTLRSEAERQSLFAIIGKSPLQKNT